MANRARATQQSSRSRKQRLSRRQLLVQQLEKRELLAAGPRLLGVNPNGESLLLPESTNPLSVRPTELTLRFGGDADLDPATFGAIKVTRAGGDGQFGNADDQPVDIGYIGFDESNRILVARFSNALADDFYKVEVVGVDNGATGDIALRDTQGDAFEPTDPNSDRETLFFNLELGARVTAVVPQPVVGTLGSRTQLDDEIHVYFDDADLFANGGSASLTDPAFYTLIRTEDTVTTSDDSVINPTSVTVTPGEMRVELHFGAPLHTLPGSGVFRLRIGTSEAVNTPLDTPAMPGGDVGNVAASAFDLGAFTGRQAAVTQGRQILDTVGLPLDYPGDMEDFGHRLIQSERHNATTPADGTDGISVISYSVRIGMEYGVDSANRPVFNAMNPEQQRRVREIMAFYGEYFGIDFVEIDSDVADLRIVVGDLNPVGQVSSPSTPPNGSFNAMAGLVVMDGADNWDDAYGGDFLTETMREIGHVLGLGDATDLPEGTIMARPNSVYLGDYLEYIFPGNHDIVHGQYMFRPDNRDVDMYRFAIPAGEKGTIRLETFANRLTSASLLDTSMVLYRQTSAGDLEVVSANNDFFGTDSYIQLDVEEGVYFLAVTAHGNEDFNPTVANTGSGATSQGDYDLRVEFRSSQANALSDVTGAELDGDGDGVAGGNFNFWFKANDPTSTIFVDPSAPVGGNGTLNSPFRLIPDAFAAAGRGDVVRLLPSSGLDLNPDTQNDNRAYEVGRNTLNQALADGTNLLVPAGVTVMVDPGVIMKFHRSRITVGSGEGGIERSGGAIQVLGTPDNPVIFTSYNDHSLAINSNPLVANPSPGDWGGIQIRNDVDRAQGRPDLEREGIFLNYVAGALFNYGGGQVTVNNQPTTVTPIDMQSSRPTLLHNTVINSVAGAFAADPNSFEESTFNEPQYQRFDTFVSEYGRTGPVIYGNTLVNNVVNGLVVRVREDVNGNLQELTVPARFANTEVVHVLSNNLTIAGRPGGPIVDATLPGLDIALFSPTVGAGTLAAGQYQYQMSFLDAAGNESLAPTPSLSVTLGAAGAITITGVPVATGDFVGRRMYRSLAGGPFEFVADLDRSSQIFMDSGLVANPNLTALTGAVLRPRLDGRLAIDPGIIVKSESSKLATDFGGDLIAEGAEGREIIFTSITDDRFGAGGTLNTNSSLNPTAGSMGSWAGIYAAPLSTLSIDHAVIAFAGGSAGEVGTTFGFNAVEIHQADARIAHTLFENNASGLLSTDDVRGGFGRHDRAVIHVAGAQPVIVNNNFRGNSVADTAAISFDLNSFNTTFVNDNGRQTGSIGMVEHPTGNQGPLLRGNRMLDSGLAGARVRGGTLTTETVWDDTDIVHIVQETILVPDFHTYGGLRLESRADESLVVKFGANGTLIADGRPLDVEDRIGGTLQVIGAPGFPVILTSIHDDTVGAGFNQLGLPLLDTNNNGSLTTPARGNWAGLQFNEFSNDRNLATVLEYEVQSQGGTDVNGSPDSAQFIGELADENRSGDETLRLGFTVHGTVDGPGDTDVYSFAGIGGTEVWIDMDRTASTLDGVIEIIDSSGNVIARSNDSHAEELNNAVDFVNTAVTVPHHALPMRKDAFADTSFNGTYKDLYTTNPLDAGMRVVLTGNNGSADQYFIRVTGKDASAGGYQLQVRLREIDEIAGSTVLYSNIRYAQAGINTRGLPAHSLLTGYAAVNPTASAVTVNLGNILATDTAAMSVEGNLTAPVARNTFAFSVGRELPVDNNMFSTVTIDVDYADGFGRPNTSAFLYRVISPSEKQLVAIGTDSNIALDRGTPTQGGDLTDLMRGSSGSRDAFIGTIDLQAGNYELVVTSSQSLDAQLRDQYFNAAAVNPSVRLEPLPSTVRLANDNFDSPRSAAFSGAANITAYELGDVPMFVAGTVNGNSSRIFMNNAQIGEVEAVLGGTAANTDAPRLGAVAMDPRGRLVGYIAPPDPVGAPVHNDGNTGTFVLLDDGVNFGFSNAGAHGLETFTGFVDGNGNPVVDKPFGTGNARNGDGMIIHAFDFRQNNANQMFGVASRGNNDFNFNQTILDANGGIVGFRPGVGKNVLYELNRDTGVAISYNTARTGNARAQGAGTPTVEVGTLQFASGVQVQGVVKGAAFIGTRMYFVTDVGELFFLDNIPTNNPNPTNTRFLLTDPVTNGYKFVTDEFGNPIRFADLATGPQNAGGGAFADKLFAVDVNGRMFAIDTGPFHGDLLPVFAGGAFSIDTGITDPTGIDFTNVDVNLWHVETTNRRGDVGHGSALRPDFTNGPGGSQGGNSLYFGYNNNRLGGFQNLATNRTLNNYNVAGGAKGWVDSQMIDLSEYSLEDQPMLYFNYLLDAENAQALVNSGNQMRDSLRVYVAGDDGVWRLAATNNLAGANNNNFAHDVISATQIDELDMLHSRYFDENGNYAFVQRLFDTGEWRQARIPLAPFAGSERVQIRIEFNTAGEPDRNAIEIRGKAGELLDDGATFEIDAPNSPNGSTVFEFDHGLVIELPSGAAINVGDTLTVEGQVLTFVTGPAGANQISFASTDTAEDVADAVEAALTLLGGTVVRSTLFPARVNMTNATIDATASAGFAGTILGQAGVTAGNQIVITDISMDATAVRDAIRVALAAALNVPGQETNLDIYPLASNASNGVRVFGGVIADAGPLVMVGSQDGGLQLPGADSGVYSDGAEQGFGGTQETRWRFAGTRGQNNGGEGVYIDDIIIGFAERGEMVTGYANGVATSFLTNPEHEPTIVDLASGQPKTVSEIELGNYQVEIRSSAEYAEGVPGGENTQFFAWDTNDIIGQSLGIQIIGDGSSIADGDSFTLSDGIETVIFEFEDLAIAVGSPNKGVASGRVPLRFSSDMAANEIAALIRDAINSTVVQNRLDVIAGSVSGDYQGGQSSDVLVLHGSAAANNRGGTNFGLPNLIRTIRWNLGFYSAVEANPFNPIPHPVSGDANRVREQGQFIVSNSVISDSSGFAIVVDPGRRNIGGFIPGSASTQVPRPGSPISFPTATSSELAPGLTIINNILVDNAGGGVRIGGDALTGNVNEVPMPFVRVVNNTIIGTGSGVGVEIRDNASPTVVNNVIADNGTGIAAVGAVGTVEVISNVFAGNGAPVSGGLTTGTNPIVMASSNSLFINKASRNLLPAQFSPIIDNSIEFVADRLDLRILRDALGIRRSPILAPPRDLTGQLRVSDPAGGTGGGFIDRGALDRSDIFGPGATMFRPLDNDIEGVDIDAGSTFVRLVDGTLNYFDVQLVDNNGSGVDPNTISVSSLLISENGRVLVPGIDYTFGYSDTNNIIRLTPLAGIWRMGAAYEITLNNRARLAIDLPAGDAINDGDTITITDTQGNVATLEFDTGFVVTIPAAGVNDGDRVLYKAQNRTRRIEWLEASSGRQPLGNSNIVITYQAGDSPARLAELLADGLRQLNQGLETATAIEGNRVYVGGQPSDTITFEGAALPVSGTPGVTAGSFAVPMIPSSLLSSDVVAGQVVAAITRAQLNGTWNLASSLFAPGGGAIWFDQTAAISSSSGVFGTARRLDPIRDFAGNQLIPNRPNGETQFTILMPGVQLDFGDAPFTTLAADQGAQHVLGNVALPRLGHLAGADLDGYPAGSDDSSPAVTITTTSNLLAEVVVNLADVSKAELVFGGLGFDPLNDVYLPNDGDRISINVGSRTLTFELTSDAGVGAGNIAVPFDPATVTRESMAAAFAAVVNGQVWQIAKVTVDATDATRVLVDTDDEDGVGVGAIQLPGSLAGVSGLFVTPSGEFLSFLNPVDGSGEISVTTTGSGLLDAWIDFDQNGSFDDIGEQVLINTLVLEGENRIRIPVPTNAVEGLTWARFRLTTSGNQDAEGIAIVGEVEDYQVRVVSVTPPTLVNDDYTTDEDTPLVVSAADGVLNGAGADSFVGLDNVQTELDESPLFGTLQLNADGSFTYTADPNFYGTDSFTYRLFATRELVPGDPTQGLLPVRSSDSATVTITVNPINDVPLAVDKVGTVLEDLSAGLTFTAAELLVGALPADLSTPTEAPWDESGQQLRITAIGDGTTSVTAPTGNGAETASITTGQGITVTANFMDGALVDVTYFPSNNYNWANPLNPAAPLPSLDSFTFTVTDDGAAILPDGSRLPVTPEESRTATVVITVDPVNDPPEFNFVSQHTFAEDAGFITSLAAANLLPGPINANDEAGQVVTFQLTADPANRTGLFTTPPSIDSNGVLSFETAPNQNGTVVYTVVATDNGPNDATIGDNPSAAPVQLTITITPVNDAPEFTAPVTIDVLEDNGPYALQYATNILAGPSNATDEGGQRLTFQVVADPANPAGLLLANPTIDQTGFMRFSAAIDAVGTAVYYVTLVDDGGLSNPGDVNTSIVHTVTINVRPVNDAPRVTAVGPVRYNVLEDNLLVIPVTGASSLLNQFSVGPTNEADGTLGGNQTLRLLDFGTQRTTHGSVTAVTNGSGDVVELRYLPDRDFNGGPTLPVSDRIFFTVADDGTTWSLTSGGLVANPLTAQYEIELVIEPVNDEPVFNALVRNILRLEDVGSVSVPGWATNIAVAPPTASDENNPVTGQQLHFEVTPAPGYTQADIDAMFLVPPSVTVDGTLSYTSAPDAVGTVVVLVTAVDSGAHDPARGDDRRSVPVSLTLSLAPVNDPPVANQASVSYELDEDNALDIPLHNVTGTGLYDIFTVGPNNEGPGLVWGGNQTFATDPGLYPSTTANGGRIAPYFDQFGALAGLRYTPALDYNGTDTFVYGVRDNGQTYVMALGALVNDFREQYATVSLTVNAVNDRPQFAGGVDVLVNEDAGSDVIGTPASDIGLSVINNWATNILAGPATAVDENDPVSGQQLGFQLTYASGVNPADLFEEQPAVDPVTGQLRFKTKPDANGRVVFDVVLVDNGPTGHLDGDITRPENLNSSVPRQFAITVQAVNDKPTFTAGGQVNVDEDSGPYNLVWATNISPGPADEVAAGQAVLFDVIVSSADQAKFSQPPTITDGGLLRFTPADNANGTIVATVIARDTAGADTSPGVPLTINIRAVNDAPIVQDDTLSSDEDTVMNIPASTLLANDNDVDLPADAISIAEIISPTTQGATVTLSGDGSRIIYDPTGSAIIQGLRPGETTSDTFTYRIVDLAGVTSQLATVTINLTGINDVPVAVNDTPSVNRSGGTSFSPLANDRDVDGSLVPGTLLVTLQPAFGSLSVDANGVMTYTPFDTFTGSDLIRYVVRDDLGAVSNQASIFVTVNDAPFAEEDFVETYRNESVTFNPLANDSDPDPNGGLNVSTVEVVLQPQHGLVIVNDDGTMTYSPDTDYFGGDTFTYRVRDNQGTLSNVAQVNIRIIPSRLQNPRLALDVNDSGDVSPIDALLIINHLHRGGATNVNDLPPGPPYFDVDGNLLIAPIDALRVINFLNRNASGEGEGQSLAAGAITSNTQYVGFDAAELPFELSFYPSLTQDRACTSAEAWQMASTVWADQEDEWDRLYGQLAEDDDAATTAVVDSVWEQFDGLDD